MNTPSNPFDQRSASWDAQEYRVERARLVAEQIGSTVNVSKESTVLDFGCGTGLLGFHFTSQAKKVVFADTSAGMLAQVQAKAQQHGIVNITTLDLNTQTHTERYDLIATLLALHHIEDYHLCIRELTQNLAEGGSICLCDLDCEDGSFHGKDSVPHNGFDRQEIAQLLTACGLTVQDIRTGYIHTRIIDGITKEYPLFVVTGKK